MFTNNIDITWASKGVSALHNRLDIHHQVAADRRVLDRHSYLNFGKLVVPSSCVQPRCIVELLQRRERFCNPSSSTRKCGLIDYDVTQTLSRVSHRSKHFENRLYQTRV